MTPVRHLLWIACAGASPLLAAQTVTLTELPPPDGYPVASVANIAADGTVVGAVYPDGYVARWVPGQAPEVLEGGNTFTLDNITPLLASAAGAIVTTAYFDDGGDAPVAAPERWLGGIDWGRYAGPAASLGNATAFGISSNGTYIAGVADPAVPPADGPWPQIAWVWSDADGQVPLAIPAEAFSAQAWAVSDDGATVAGFATTSPDSFTRYGMRWDDGVPQWIVDGTGQHVGQAIGCNADGSVIVGAGVEDGTGDPRAWRWRRGVGLDYLDPPAGAAADTVAYAFESSADGAVVVGSFLLVDPVFGPANHGFYWTSDGGAREISDFLAGHDIQYGAPDWTDLLVVGVTPDGSRLLINGIDADYTRHRAVVEIVPDETIFSDGFEGITPFRGAPAQ